MMQPHYYGKFRGKVLDNVDPLLIGRVQVLVPSVPGIALNWALPCAPYAGPNVGFFAIPPVGADVWVEFEGGDLNLPIWSGCFWGEGQVPLELGNPEVKIFKTEAVTLMLSDVPGTGGLTIEVAPPAVETPLSMRFDSEGVTILVGESTTITLSVADTITLTTPPAQVTVSAEAISLAIPASTLDLTEEAIAVETPALNVTAAVEIEGDVNAVGAVEIEGNVNVVGGVEVEGEVVAVEAVEVAITTPAMELTAAALAITGAVEVTGELLIDGQQPIVI